MDPPEVLPRTPIPTQVALDLDTQRNTSMPLRPPPEMDNTLCVVAEFSPAAHPDGGVDAESSPPTGVSIVCSRPLPVFARSDDRTRWSADEQAAPGGKGGSPNISQQY